VAIHHLNQEATSRGARMLRTALGPAIALFLQDSAVVEVMLNPDGRLLIDRLAGGLVDTGERLSSNDGERIVRLVAHHVGASTTLSAQSNLAAHQRKNASRREKSSSTGASLGAIRRELRFAAVLHFYEMLSPSGTQIASANLRERAIVAQRPQVVRPLKWKPYDKIRACSVWHCYCDSIKSRLIPRKLHINSLAVRSMCRRCCDAPRT
jgi:hypothetical protein